MSLLQVINELIAVLVQEQKDEKVKKDWCVLIRNSRMFPNPDSRNERFFSPQGGVSLLRSFALSSSSSLSRSTAAG